MPSEPEPIAVLNAGSSSLKFSFFQGASVVCKGLVDRLGSAQSGARAAIRDADGASLFEGPVPARNHEQALAWLLDWLRQTRLALSPAAVGHRVVHGGDEFSAPARVTPEVLDRLESLVPLAPLHQPHNLAPIRYLARQFPQLPQVVCFDTAFHATQTRIERTYA
ncbi:MAG: hypothetical protein L0211_12935 [Planctomycetaceae bacterium]|nr:hypothetical protein [Planctomycetaceae bacterium]